MMALPALIPSLSSEGERNIICLIVVQWFECRMADLTPPTASSSILISPRLSDPIATSLYKIAVLCFPNSAPSLLIRLPSLFCYSTLLDPQWGK